MIGLIIAVILILFLILYVLKSIFNDTDFQTWLNILIITVILFTVILSIYIILNRVKATDNPTAPKIKTEQSVEEKPTEEKSVEEMSDDELSLTLAKEYLTLKADYEKQHVDEDGTPYAETKMMDEYGLTKEEWHALYEKFAQNGYLDRAAKELNMNVDYLIKTK